MNTIVIGCYRYHKTIVIEVFCVLIVEVEIGKKDIAKDGQGYR